MNDYEAASLSLFLLQMHAENKGCIYILRTTATYVRPPHTYCTTAIHFLLCNMTNDNAPYVFKNKS